MTAESRARYRPGISIVCVFNDLDVRKECLDRSIELYDGPVDIDYRPVDNRMHQFTTAGAALNHGASGARHELVVFPHQDVYLHSIDRLVAAGAWLQDGGWSMLGASGVTSNGEVVGRLRDRTELIGRRASVPVEVETLDEVLFMVRRDVLRSKPLTEDPDLAWHAYAVEYACRLRETGERVGAIDAAITHNSLTINLDRLDVAHRVVGERYPAQLPIHTTCGTVGDRRWKIKDLPLVRDHRWRLRWLRGSLAARRISHGRGADFVLADIRHDVDQLKFSTDAALHVINLDDRGGDFSDSTQGWLRLRRVEKPVDFIAVGSFDEVADSLASLPADTNVLVTGLDDGLVTRLLDDGDLSPRSWLVGIQSGPHWVLAGPVLEQLPDAWSERRSVPLGSPRRRISSRRE